MIFIGKYWDIWSDVASFSLRQHTTKIFYVYPLDLNILSAFHPGLKYVKKNKNPYSKTLIFFLYSNCWSSTVYIY